MTNSATDATLSGPVYCTDSAGRTSKWGCMDSSSFRDGTRIVSHLTILDISRPVRGTASGLQVSDSADHLTI